MNLDKLNQWLTLSANIGVLVGILFLAIEIRQNTEAVQSQTRNSVTEQLTNWYMDIATNYDTAIIFSSGIPSEGIDLSTPEGLTLQFLLQSNFRLWENELYQYEKGLFEEDEFLARRATWELVLRSTDSRVIWESIRMQFAPRFRAEIDSIVQEVER